MAGIAVAEDKPSPRDMSRDLVTRGLPAEETTVASGPIELTIASYNVQCRPFLDKPLEKLPQIAPKLNAFDVVLLQELFVRPDLVWAGAKHPNKAYFGRFVSPSKVAGSGLAILSRLPMGEVVSEHFRDVGELQNQLASKGLLLARLRVGGAWLDVYDTHMEAGDTRPAQVARRGQAKQVVEFVGKHSPADHAVILMGDFNMGPLRAGLPWREYSHFSNEADMASRTAAFATMVEGLKLRDAWDEVHGPKDTGIERLLFRSGTACALEPLACDFDGKGFRRADGTSLSDGSPLIVTMKVTPKAN